MSERWLKVRQTFIKLTHWEYWPFNVVYAPMLLYYFYLAAKARSFFFFNTANPLIKNGGFLLESKKEIYDLLPSHLYPKTLLMAPDSHEEFIMNSVKEAGIEYPFIAKPDIGQRGMLVKLVTNQQELKEYLAKVTVPFLLQEYVDYEEEVGIFYCKIPGDPQGKITGIVGKEFLKVIGNGSQSIEDLLVAEPRFLLQLTVLRKTYGDELRQVLALGEERLLVPYGNHSRGSKFVDMTHKADTIFRANFEAICQSIPEFYFGRMDVKFSNWEDLRSGKNFSIIELNGAGSEPTHMYDPKHSIFYAWGQIMKHLRLLYRISMLNKTRTGMNFMNAKEGLEMLKENNRQIERISQ